MAKTLAIYLMSGPDTPELANAAVDGGADIVELGFPFSDPLADGPVVRRAAEKALAQGMRTQACLECLAAVRARVDVPLVPMTYSSLLEAYGWERFAESARAAGATSLIVADLPAGERPELQRVQLVAPTSTDERLRLAAELTDGWLYLVTLTGTTGARSGLSASLVRTGRARAGRCRRRAALRGLRHLDACRRAGGGGADRRRRRRLAGARGGRGRPGGARRVRPLVARRARQPDVTLSRDRPAAHFGDGRTRDRRFRFRQLSSTMEPSRGQGCSRKTKQRGSTSWGPPNCRERRSASASCCACSSCSASPPQRRLQASPPTGRRGPAPTPTGRRRWAPTLTGRRMPARTRTGRARALSGRPPAPREGDTSFW